MKRKLIAIFLMLAMLLSLASACCTGAQSSQAAEIPSETTESAVEMVQASALEETEEAEEAEEVENVADSETETSCEETPEPSEPEEAEDNFIYATYPLVDETTTFSIWIAYNSPAVADFNEQQAVLTAREITGITIDYLQFSPMVASEQFNLMVASGDYTDMIHGAVTQYNGGGTRAVQDDVLIDLLDIANVYAPNFMNIMKSDENIYRDCINDDANTKQYQQLRPVHRCIADTPSLRAGPPAHPVGPESQNNSTSTTPLDMLRWGCLLPS